jgi:hypothetical protein
LLKSVKLSSKKAVLDFRRKQMSNLSKRVEKAKKTRIIPAIDGSKGCYNVYGSRDDLYKVCLKSGMKNLVTPDGYRPTKVFRTNCQKSVVNLDKPYQEQCEYCKGNQRHTVCYHCLGAIWFALTNASFQVSFHETYHSAVNGLNFGGEIAKIENQNGTGSVWCVYRKKEKKEKKQQFVMLLPEQKTKILSAQENINLMRGSDSEAID